MHPDLFSESLGLLSAAMLQIQAFCLQVCLLQDKHLKLYKQDETLNQKSSRVQVLISTRSIYQTGGTPW